MLAIIGASLNTSLIVDTSLIWLFFNNDLLTFTTVYNKYFALNCTKYLEDFNSVLEKLSVQ